VRAPALLTNDVENYSSSADRRFFQASSRRPWSARFVTHFLQVSAASRGSAAAAAMTNNHNVRVGHFFFNVELDRAATHVSRAGMCLHPIRLYRDIDYDRVAVFNSQRHLRRISVMCFFASATSF